MSTEPKSEPTVEVIGLFGRPKQITRAEFIERWRRHAVELMHIGINVTDQAAENAGHAWDTMYEKENGSSW